ncbi:MAG TPA: cysteine--1-D-myo-inosityl 2-amino-2-deoxy-alpha-D-glucopyranoside ligase [Actinomycetes bacterium]|nr:cysteine--1-D-myo-inosityl 2-amino-2-deoxy-alpha-D-glucopyranoside ligase [Actinomycetes bacterium]
METWSRPAVPELPGEGRQLSLHDTVTGSIRPTTPQSPARLYVCGITPYDATHLGHASTYIAFDLVQRMWLDAGLEVHYVQNVTDIDDPLLERAVATGQDWKELARAETALFRDDMVALGVLPPQEYIGAVESIPLIVERITELLSSGAAYRVDDDIYFSTASDADFGSVGKYDRDRMLELFAERGGDPDRTGKKDPLDPLLWQAERPGEPAWDTTLGHGRPGWHIECTAIALHYLGTDFDVQGGGSDLIFPHHEMGASQGHVLTPGYGFAKHFVHTGMVGLGGEKMSKSKGNLVFVSRLRDDGHDPMAIRLALLAHHYRDDWDWHDEDLTTAEDRLLRWTYAVTADQGPSAEQVVERVRDALASDLDSPAALRTIDEWAESVAAGAGDDPDAPGQVADLVLALLGVDLVR